MPQSVVLRQRSWPPMSIRVSKREAVPQISEGVSAVWWWGDQARASPH